MRLPTFSIRWLLLAVAVAAVVSWLCSNAIQPFAIVAAAGCLVVMALMGVIPWLWLKDDPDRAATVLVVSTALAFVALVALGVFAVNMLAGVFRIMVGWAVLPFVFGAGVAWANLASSEQARRRLTPFAAWSRVIGVFLLMVSLLFSRWPMRAAFAASRPALERLADRVASGERLARPEWAGLFLVRKVARTDVGPGNVALVVENDSSGKTWLVRAAAPGVRPGFPPSAMAHLLVTGGPWWHCELD